VAEGVGQEEEPDQAEEPEQPLPGGGAEAGAESFEQGAGAVPEDDVGGQQGQRGSTKIRL
jgi:hypothetical protein